MYNNTIHTIYLVEILDYQLPAGDAYAYGIKAGSWRCIGLWDKGRELEMHMLMG